jgi:hypothetical protein
LTDHHPVRLTLAEGTDLNGEITRNRTKLDAGYGEN